MSPNFSSFARTTSTGTWTKQKTGLHTAAGAAAPLTESAQQVRPTAVERVHVPATIGKCMCLPPWVSQLCLSLLPIAPPLIHALFFLTFVVDLVVIVFCFTHFSSSRHLPNFLILVVLFPHHLKPNEISTPSREPATLQLDLLSSITFLHKANLTHKSSKFLPVAPHPSSLAPHPSSLAPHSSSLAPHPSPLDKPNRRSRKQGLFTLLAVIKPSLLDPDLRALIPNR